jgi:hypothetical protein
MKSFLGHFWLMRLKVSTRGEIVYHRLVCRTPTAFMADQTSGGGTSSKLGDLNLKEVTGQPEVPHISRRIA